MPRPQIAVVTAVQTAAAKSMTAAPMLGGNIVAVAAEVLITEVKVVAPTMSELLRVHRRPLTANATAPDAQHCCPSNQDTS